MQMMKTKLNGVLIIEPKVIGDNRGWFMETFRADKLKAEGCEYNFVQDNQSFSAQKGTLRGIHFQQFPYAQTKLVRCLKGGILDVAVDLRKWSPTYKQWVAVELNEGNKKQLLIPRGFGHGFLTLTDNVEIAYKCDGYYNAKADRSLRFDDPGLGIDWGVKNPIVSDKDRNAPPLRDSDCNFGDKVLVTGVRGQLGYDVVKLLNEKGIECLGVDINDFDITDERQTMGYIKKYNPAAVVHCAAYTAVDKAEAERELCFAVNVKGTANIVAVCKELDAKMIYISTDYVYGGAGEKPYVETDKTDPQNYYGLTKLQGEERVREAVDKHFIARTSWVFGKNGGNFVRTMLKLGKEKPEINVVSDQTGSPTYTADLARLLVEMVFSNKYGTYNASNEGYTSWNEFAREIFRLAGVKTPVNSIKTADYKTAARRPFNSRLDKGKLEQNGFTRLPEWKDALQRYLKEIDI